MDYPKITKPSLDQYPVRPNLEDYEAARSSFSWEDSAGELDWFDSHHINIAHVAIDAHLKNGLGAKKALIWESTKGVVEEFTFAEMARLSNRFANVLTHELGVQKGDRVFFFLERIPEIFIGILGTLKAGAVIGPLFSAFGPEAVKDRLADSRVKVLVTSPALKKKVAEIFADLPHLERIVLVHRGKSSGDDADDLSYEEAMQRASDDFETVKTSRDDYSIMHYTSAPPASPRALFTLTMPSSATMPQPSTFWICTPMTYTGAPPTRAG